MHEHVVKIQAGRNALPLPGYVLLALALGLLTLGLLFQPEIQAAIEVWNASTAYSHCYLVLPMTLYLLWDRRSLLAQSTVRPEPVIALAAIPVAVVWLIAERLGFMEGRQLAVVAGLEVLVATMLGRSLFWRLSGPLLFLFFLVPFGAFLTPALQRFTASFSIIGLDLLGIPNYSDKFTIETPAGIFFVAEACAGLRFLIAAIAFGVFYALLNYTSPARRAAFIAASIIVPIVANGFRALGIVVLGQILDSAQAAAADHIVYGWIFFSLVMLLLIAAGQAFRDEAPRDVISAPLVMVGRARSPLPGAIAALFLLGMGPAIAKAIDSRSSAPVLLGASPIVAPAGCSTMRDVGDLGGSRRRSVTICGGTKFEISVDLFPTRSTSSALISERRRVTQEVGAEDVSVATVDVPESAGRWTLVQTTDPNRLTAYASWVGGKPVLSSMTGRIAQAEDSLLGSQYAPALITVTTAESADALPVQRKATQEALTSLVRQQAYLNERMSSVSRVEGR